MEENLRVIKICWLYLTVDVEVSFHSFSFETGICFLAEKKNI